MRHKLLVRLTFLAMAFSELVTWPCAIRAQPAQFPSSDCKASILRLKLVLPGHGWVIVGPAGGGVCAAQRIYWTEDNGKAWRDITPPDMPTHSIGQVFFLDSLHAWMLSTDALADQENTRFYLLSTEDAGKHWRTLMLQRPMFDLMDDYYFPTQLFFSDPQHGWILWHWHMMNSSQDALLTTKDGGRTWNRSGDAVPGVGPMQFLSARDGWMIGGPEEWEDVGRPENTQLWLTHDSGAHWKAVHIPVPIPKDSPEQEPYLTVFRFNDMGKGVVIAEEQLGPRLFRVFTCRTRDGGESWRISHFDAYDASPVLGDKHIFWSISDRVEEGRHGRATPSHPRLQIDSDPISFALPAGISPESRLIDLDFIDDSNAWASYIDRGQARLTATTDGGKTSKLMPLPVTTQPLSLH
jgi:photosystem II stability/assembly factor-like uncharacterized protein